MQWIAIIVAILPVGILGVIALYTRNADLSYADHAALLGTAAAFVAVFLAFGAAIVAILAYWAATKVPDLDIVVGPLGEEGSGLRLHAVTYADNTGDRIVRTPKSMALKLTMTLECRTRVSAHHPAVRVELIGLKLLTPQTGWDVLESQEFSWTQKLQWDGGADAIVHWRLGRPLPPVDLQGESLRPRMDNTGF
jgi:hypothetical protein